MKTLLPMSFERAAEEGRIGFSTLVVTGDSTVAKICLDPEDITNAREQAAKRGLRCHACLTLIIQEAAQCGRLAERSLALNSCFPRVRAVDRFHSAPTGRRVRGGPLTQGVASLCPGLLSRSPYRRIGLVPMTEAAGGSCFPRSQKRDLAHPVSVADWREAQLAAPQVLGHGFAAHRLEAQLV
jgi:hypothetical protein